MMFAHAVQKPPNSEVVNGTAQLTVVRKHHERAVLLTTDWGVGAPKMRRGVWGAAPLQEWRPFRCK